MLSIRFVITVLLLAVAAFGQSLPPGTVISSNQGSTFTQALPPAATPAATTPLASVPTSNLPDYLIGTGVAWNRGTAYPLSNVTTIGVRIGASNIFSWSTLDTPVAPTPTGAPVPSSVRTGAAFVAAQTATGSAFLFFLGDIGLSTTPSASAAGYSAGAGVAIRIKRTHWYVMPLYRLVGTVGSATTAVPEVMAAYTFGGN